MRCGAPGIVFRYGRLLYCAIHSPPGLSDERRMVPYDAESLSWDEDAETRAAIDRLEKERLARQQRGPRVGQVQQRAAREGPPEGDGTAAILIGRSTALDEGFVPVCECGWRGAPAPTMSLAMEAVRRHQAAAGVA